MLSEADMGTNPNTHRATKSQEHRVHDGRRASAHCLSTLQPWLRTARARSTAGRLGISKMTKTARPAKNGSRLRTLARPLQAPKDSSNRADSVLLHLPHHRTTCGQCCHVSGNSRPHLAAKNALNQA
eukprot:scaffold4731_cov144-Isochrysis_galbana.AAC.7